jgi:predicted ATPase
LAFAYGQDIGVVCAMWAAWALWFLGYPDQARQMADQGLEAAQTEFHSMTVSYAWTFSAFACQFVRDRARARAVAESALQFASEHEIPFFAAMSTVLVGVLAEPSDLAAGLAQARGAMAATRAIGAELTHPYLLTQIAEAHASAGQVEPALAAVAEGQALIERGDEFAWQADLYRMEGDLRLMQGARETAEACFHKALEIARQQSARSYELRTAVSLSALWLQQGERDRAHALLSGIYAWFTEGFNTSDLKRAKALLDEMG